MKLKYLDGPEEAPAVATLADEGIFYLHIDTSNWKEPLDRLCAERGYKNRDEVFISLTPDVKPSDREFTTGKQILLTRDNDKLDSMLEKFFEEHLHEDEEIRFVLGGAGRFDVRDKQDRWIAITVEEGDLLIVPARMYHRFGLADSNFVHAMRLFSDQPKWEAIPRVAK